MQIENWLQEICKIGQGAQCCKFLTVGPGGFSCGKMDPAIYAGILATWHLAPHTAQGDNCDGVSDATLNQKEG